MKIVVIGDLHGKDLWKRLSPEDYDLMVFLGDYVDHWTISNTLILHNLKEIIALKKKYPDKVVLLTGNHDFQYMYGSLSDYSFICSGFRPEAYWDLYNEFNDNEALFQVAHKVGNYIFSHAGITMAWWKKVRATLEAKYIEYNLDEDMKNVHVVDVLNFTRLIKQRELLWEIGVKRGGMRGDNGSPIWADGQESRFGVLRGYHHIVGHTPIKFIKKYKVDDNTTITYCDCLENIDNYLVIEIKDDKSEETII
jgi:hypothetical protein